MDEIGTSKEGEPQSSAGTESLSSWSLSPVSIPQQWRPSQYIVKDILGHGTFGQVAKCWVAETSRFVAVKIIKKQPAYYQQALVEVSILATLNRKYDPGDRYHIVRIYDYFVYRRHLCITFELLDTNLPIGPIGGYTRPMTNSSHLMPQLPHSSPSRLRHQPVQQFNNGRSVAVSGFI